MSMTTVGIRKSVISPLAVEVCVAGNTKVTVWGDRVEKESGTIKVYSGETTIALIGTGDEPIARNGVRKETIAIWTKNEQ